MATDWVPKGAAGKRKSRVDQQQPSVRVPPQNLDAERGILGSILIMNEAIDEIGELLRPEHLSLIHI